MKNDILDFVAFHLDRSRPCRIFLLAVLIGHQAALQPVRAFAEAGCLKQERGELLPEFPLIRFKSVAADTGKTIDGLIPRVRLTHVLGMDFWPGCIVDSDKSDKRRGVGGVYCGRRQQRENIDFEFRKHGDALLLFPPNRLILREQSNHRGCKTYWSDLTLNLEAQEGFEQFFTFYRSYGFREEVGEHFSTQHRRNLRRDSKFSVREMLLRLQDVFRSQKNLSVELRNEEMEVDGFKYHSIIDITTTLTPRQRLAVKVQLNPAKVQAEMESLKRMPRDQPLSADELRDAAEKSLKHRGGFDLVIARESQLIQYEGDSENAGLTQTLQIGQRFAGQIAWKSSRGSNQIADCLEIARAKDIAISVIGDPRDSAEAFLRYSTDVKYIPTFNVLALDPTLAGTGGACEGLTIY